MSNFTLNTTFIDIDVTNPDQKYEDVWALFFSVPILPFSLTLVWVLAGLYIVGMVLFSRFTRGDKSGTERFSASPWWALAWCKSSTAVLFLPRTSTDVRVARIIVAFIGVIFFLGCRFARIPAFPLGPFSIPAFTFFLDLGSYFIVIGQIRAFFIVTKIHRSFRYTLLRRLWGFFVFVMLAGGLYLSPFKINPGFIDLSNAPEWLTIVADAGYAIAGISRSLLGITMVAILPFMIRTAIFASRRDPKFDHARWVTSLAFLATFLVFLPIIIPSILRIWISLRISLPVYIVTSTLPELVIFGIWVALGRFVTRQDALLAKKQEQVRDCLRLVWLGYMTTGQLEGLPTALREFLIKYNIVLASNNVRGMHGVLNMMWYYASALPSQRQFAGMTRPPRLLRELEGLFEGLRVPASPEAERISRLKDDEKSRSVGWLKDAVGSFQEGMRQKFISAELADEVAAENEGYYEKGVDPESGFTAGEALRMHVKATREGVDFGGEMEGFEQYDMEKFGDVQIFVHALCDILGKSVVLVERRQDSIFRDTVLWQIDTAATRVEFVRNLLDAPFKPASIKDAGDLADIWLELLLWERGVLF